MVLDKQTWPHSMVAASMKQRLWGSYMKNLLAVKAYHGWLALCGAVALVGVLPAAANTATPIHVEMSLATKPTITLGEPILLQYSVVNDTQEKVGVEWGRAAGYEQGSEQAGWYTITLTDVAGNSVPAAAEATSSRRGFTLMPDPFLSPNTASKNFAVVTRRFVVPHPGRYVLKVHIQLPYAVVPKDQESPLVLKDDLKSAGTVLTQDYSFPLTVTRFDEPRLQATAEALRKAIGISNLSDGNRRSADIDALFSMPEAQAAPSWKLMANDPGMNAWGIADRLGRVHSAVAADILAQMRQDPRLSPDVQNQISRSLNEMYNNGDAPLRSHVRNIGASFGISMPEKVAIPVPTD